MSEDTHLEPDKPKNVRLLVMIVVTIGALIVSVVLIVQFWNFTIQAEVDRKQQRPVASALANLRASEEGRLTNYEWANQTEGVVRIPVARAIELTLRDWDSRPTGLMDSADKMALDKQKANTPPAPEPAPAPPGGAAPAPAPRAPAPGAHAPAAPAQPAPAAPAPRPNP
jgi:hypothetical protein